MKRSAEKRTLNLPGVDIREQTDANAPSLGATPRFRRRTFECPGEQPLAQRLSTHIADEEGLPLCREPGLRHTSEAVAPGTCQECRMRASKLRAVIV